MADERIVQALALEGRSFVHCKKRYDVSAVEQRLGKIVIKTKCRTFVWTPEQIPTFLSEIRLIDENGPEKPAFVPDKEKLPLKQNTMANVPAEVTASLQMTDQVSDALLKQFEVLSGAPSEEDYKKAEAMSKLANTMVQVAQTKINYLKLKGNV